MSFFGNEQATMLIEILPSGGLDIHNPAVCDLSRSEPYVDYLGDGYKNAILHKQHYDRIVKVKDRGIGMCYRVSLNNFFLGDTEAIKSFLDSSEKHQRLYLIDNQPKEPSSQGDDTNADSQFCVRVTLLPIIKPQRSQEGRQGPLRVLLEKIKNLFHVCIYRHNPKA